MISARDVDNIYKVPLVYRAEGMDDLVLDHFRMEDARRPSSASGRQLVRRADDAEGRVRIALVGKYVQLADAYKSVIEALDHGGFHHGVDVEVDLVDSEDVDETDARGRGRDPDPGRLRRARDRGQGRAPRRSRASGRSRSSASASACRSRSSSSPATSAAWTARTPPSSIPRRPYPVIDLLPEQKEVTEMGGTMRLGADPVKLHEGTRARRSTATRP